MNDYNIKLDLEFNDKTINITFKLSKKDLDIIEKQRSKYYLNILSVLALRVYLSKCEEYGIIPDIIFFNSWWQDQQIDIHQVILKILQIRNEV